MTKLSRRPHDPEFFGHYVNNLWSAFTLMDSKEDIKFLFKDLFTHTEYKMFAKRLEIARRLISGETYEAIINALKVTAPTITKINNTLAAQGFGLRKADEKLKILENKYDSYRKQKQLRMEHRTMPKYKHMPHVTQILKTGALALSNTVKTNIKNHSAQKNLDL